MRIYTGTLESDVSRDSRILQSPVLSGFEDNQFQQMCLRLDFKRDHSRDSEALRSPLNLPNDKTPLPSESEAEFQPNLRGSTNTF